MWNRFDYPTVNDADEWGNILILRNNGQKAVYNWEDFCDEKLMRNDIAWMPLPPSDNVEEDQPITITISSGGRSFAIEKVGSNIEVHDSRDPMGQPIISEEVDGLDGVLRVVESILVDGFIEAPYDDDDCWSEEVDSNDVDTMVSMFTPMTPMTPQNFNYPYYSNNGGGTLQNFIDAIRGSTSKQDQKICQCNRGKESKPRPWQKNRGK